jgi:hypothetical protein
MKSTEPTGTLLKTSVALESSEAKVHPAALVESSAVYAENNEELDWDRPFLDTGIIFSSFGLLI